MTASLRATRAIANFDSGASTLTAVARFLHGRDFAALGMLPAPLARAAEPIAPALNRLPPHIRQSVYGWSGWTETVPARKVARVRADRVADWMAARYPQRRYPAVAVGAANGALAHLCAALGIPLLPQTFLVPLRQHGRHVDEPLDDIALGREAARRLLGANPDVQLHQMHDPNQDRLMLRHITYFRLKWRRLPAAFAAFLERRLAPGATVLVSDCAMRWPVARLGEHHVFQFGGVGGIGPDEYRSGSDRIAGYLARHGSHRRRWDPPPPDEESAEAEWGFEPALLEDVQRLAHRCAWRMVRLRYQEPDDLGLAVAGLYRSWYRAVGLPDDRLLVESFALLDPWWALRTASVPLWLTFAVERSAARLERHLSESPPYAEIRVTAFPHGIESIGSPGADRWRQLAGRGRHIGELVGIDADAYPRDLGAFLRFHADLRAIPHRHDMPDPLTIAEAERLLRGQPGIGWHDAP